MGLLGSEDVVEIVSAYCKARGEDFAPTRRTVRNWSTRGIEVEDGTRVTLKTEKTIGNSAIFTHEAVMAFLEKAGPTISSNRRGRGRGPKSAD